MSEATRFLERLVSANFRNVEVDWEQLLRLSYSVLLDANLSYCDVGGNLGAHANCFLTDMKAANLAIFEPIPQMRDHLESRFGARSNVSIYPYALADQTVQTTFFVKPGALAESGLARKDAYSDGRTDNLEAIPVSVRRLDDVELGFAPDFIKIDIEGAEIDMLRGARETIAAARPLISVEYGSTGYEAFGHTAASLPTWCQENHYEIYDLFGNRFAYDEFLACVNRYYWDYVLVPAERLEALAARFEILRRVTLPVPLSKWRETNLDIINRI